MSLFTAAIASGSNGNCYYVGTSHEAILVDAGVSCREIERRMKRLGLSMLKVKALFISHEHSDHVCGVTVLARKYNLPVYISESTLRNGSRYISNVTAVHFKHLDLVTIGSLTITPFLKWHDAAEPFSFTIESNGVKVGVFTDIGLPCSNVIEQFKSCHAAFLEANYDEDMLMNGNYPYHLKRRISGERGHLSNTQALELFRKYRPSYMTHLILSHLSKNNNDPALVQELFDSHAGDVKMVVASRYQETALYHVHSSGVSPSQLEHSTLQRPQLELFFGD
jgi:phosphoribosyl 1,2-cyclic phosphodiesterase